MIFPWQHAQWRQLHQARVANRLSHALLFKGSAGTGKTEFADHFARALLCANNATNGDACDVCHSCRLVLGKSHPDILRIEPEKEGQAIKVDQIREVSEYISQSSLQCGYRVVIIRPANAMNVSAANALLKTLEEPSSGAILILIADQSTRLPATILSRCQSIYFACPPKELACEWVSQQKIDSEIDVNVILSLANGAPLKVKALLEGDLLAVREKLFKHLATANRQDANPLKLADNLHSHDLPPIIDFYLDWLADLLRIQTGMDVHTIKNTDYKSELMSLAPKQQADCTAELLAYVQKTRKLIGQGMNLNKQLVLENLFIRWVNYAYLTR